MSNSTVHLGFWINHDSPRVVGATLTTTIRWGNYLIAALSTLVTWGGISAWSIIAFYLHQRCASMSKKDLLDQQLQVLFRSPASPFDTLVDAIKLQRAWTGRLGKVARRTIPLAVLAVALLAMLSTAGVLVAEVASNTYQQVTVLAKPLDCGDFVPQGLDEVKGKHFQDRVDYLMLSAKRAREYTSLVYNGSREQYHSSFTQPTLPFTGKYVDCLWDLGTRCLGPNGTTGPAYNMDSGQLDSHEHFGINAPKENRVTYRKSVTCGVVDMSNFTLPVWTEHVNVSGTSVNMSYISLKLPAGNETAGHANFGININSMYDPQVAYYVSRGVFRLHDPNPIYLLSHPSFNRTDADVSYWVVTQGSVQYTMPVDDPLFLAHRANHPTLNLQWEKNMDGFFPSNNFGFLICNDQFQICNPNNGRCTGLTGAQDVLSPSRDSLGLNKAQEATAMRLVGAAKLVGYYYMGSALGTFGLLAAEYSSGQGHSLPPDHWVSEIRTWFATHLVVFQNQLLIWAKKPWDKPGEPTEEYRLMNTSQLEQPYVAAGLGDEFTKLCNNQLISTTAAVQNFSVLATALVVFVSVGFILAALWLPSCVQRRRAYRMRSGGDLSHAAEAGRLARFADEKYHLLAMALKDTAGVDSWECGTGIPVTRQPFAIPQPALDQGLARYSRKGGEASTRLRSTSPEQTLSSQTTLISSPTVRTKASEKEKDRSMAEPTKEVTLTPDVSPI